MNKPTMEDCARTAVNNLLNEMRQRHKAECATTRARNATAIMALPMTAGGLRAEIRGERVVFTGGTRGEHSLDLLVTDAARAWAHWHGYCAANGVTVPAEMPTATTAPVAAKPARKAPRRSQNRLSAAYVRRPLTLADEREGHGECTMCGESTPVGQRVWFTDFGTFCRKQCADDLRRDHDACAAEDAAAGID